MNAETVSKVMELAEAFDAQAHWDDFMDTCERCAGKGYHHGFGEDGADPDWCLDCGGPGALLNNDRVLRARAAWVAQRLDDSEALR